MAAKQLHKSHYQEVLAKLEALALAKSRPGEIAAAYHDTIRCGQVLRQPSYLHLLNVLFPTGFTPSVQPGSLSEIYERGARSFIEQLAGESMASVIGRVVARLPLYPYAPSVYHRSLRTCSLRANMRQFVQLLSCVFLPGDFDLVQWISMGRTKRRDQSDLPEDIGGLVDFVIENLIALAIDENDPAVCGAVRNGFFDNQKKVIQQILLRGMLKSADQNMYDLLFEKLLANPRDSFAQAVLQLAECGRVEPHLQLLACVLDNDLLRYDSVLKCVQVWLGFGYYRTERRSLEKTAYLALRCARDPELCRQSYLSHDPAQIQAGLWAVSLFDIEDVLPLLADLLQRGSKRQKLTALSFAAQLENKSTQAALVFHCLSEADLDIACLAMANFDMTYVTSLQTREGWQGVSRSIEALQDAVVRERYFRALASLLLRVPAEGYVVSYQPFWGMLNRESICANLFLIAAWDFDKDKTEQLLNLIQGCEAESRRRFVDIFLVQPRTEKERAFLFACLKDKSMTVRLVAAGRIGDMACAGRSEPEPARSQLTVSERAVIMNLLTLKSEEMQTVCIRILLSQPAEAVCSCARKLCLAKTEKKRLAGLALLAKLHAAGKITEHEYAGLMTEAIAAMPLNRRSAREQTLMQSMLRPKVSEDAPEYGLGLFDPHYKPALLSWLSDDQSDKFPAEKTASFAKGLLNVDKTRMMSLVAALSDKIDRYEDFTFIQVNYDLSEDETRLGNLTYMVLPNTTKRKEQGVYTLDDFVLPEVWRAWYQENHVTIPEAIALGLSMHTDADGGAQRLPWVDAALEQALPLAAARACAAEASGYTHGLLAMAIIEKIIYEFAPAAVFAVLKAAMLRLLKKIPAVQWRKTVDLQNVSQESLSRSKNHEHKPVYLFDVQEMAYSLDLMEICAVDDELFQEYAALCICFGQMADKPCIRLEIRQVARAADLGLVKPDLLYQQLCAGGLEQAFLFQDNRIFGQSDTGKEGITEEHSGKALLEQAVKGIAQRVIDIELRSSDITPVSHLALDIAHHEGVRTFVGILAMLHHTALSCGGAVSQAINDSHLGLTISGSRSTSGSRPTPGAEPAKSEVLLSLLRASAPEENDNGQSLRCMLKQVKSSEGIEAITEQTMLEAAMYVPAWTAVIAECLGWPGFFSAVCFIRVHIMCWRTPKEAPDFVCLDNGRDEDKDFLSPQTMQRINDSAFAADWLQSICQTLGERRFYRLLDAAECYADAAVCARLRLFVDAALNKIPLEILYHDIVEKRCPDKVIALGLAPLQNDRTADAMKRYEFIQEFFTQSQCFGAKRRVREKKACVVALKNLTDNAKRCDVSLVPAGELAEAYKY